MGLIDRVRSLFGGDREGPYEEAHRERLEAIRTALQEEATTLDALVAAVGLLSAADPEKITADARLLEDLGLGDLEMMELEVICEDFFRVPISSSELNLAETLQDLARMIDKKRPA